MMNASDQIRVRVAHQTVTLYHLTYSRRLLTFGSQVQVNRDPRRMRHVGFILMRPSELTVASKASLHMYMGQAREIYIWSSATAGCSAESR